MTADVVNSTVPYLLGFLSILFGVGTWQMWERGEVYWKATLIKRQQSPKTFAFMVLLGITVALFIAFAAVFWGAPLMTGKPE